jgi:hypothetical protein
MSLIEHCECFACHGTGKFEPCADEDRPALTCAECDGKGWLEHVPASQLRGAVAEIERLRGVLAVIAASRAAERGWFAQAALDAPRLDRAGGQ